MPGLTHAYYSLNGQIQGERNISTGEYTHYSTDALGSVSPMSGDKFDRCRYKPYGATLAGSPGTFGWVGSWGYAATGRSMSSHYVRARHYSTATRAWTTVDQLWPDEKAYGYVSTSPVLRIDYFGLKPPSPPPSNFEIEYSQKWHVRRSCYHGQDPHAPMTNAHRPAHYGQGCERGTSWRLFDCSSLYDAAKKCGISVHSFCAALNDGQCSEAASRFGVSANCLCAMSMSERFFWDSDPELKRYTDRYNISTNLKNGASVGCAQLRAGEVKQWIDIIRNCGLGHLLKLLKYKDADKWSHDQVRHVLRLDCEFSMQIRALQMRAAMDKKCNPRVKPENLDCESAMKKWAGWGEKWPELVARGQCLFEEFQKRNLCK